MNGVSEKASETVRLDIRMCRDCNHTLFSARDFADALAEPTPSTRAYDNLIQFERGIRLILPKFQRLLLTLQDPDNPPTPTIIQEASKTRKRLIDSFAQYDVAARRIRDLPTKSPTQQKLQSAIYVQASSFLHLHMLPLKTLPKLLKHASPHGRPLPSSDGRPNGGALASIKYSSHDASSIASSSSAVSALEAEEKELRERMIVLEEQKFFVQEMIRDAGKRRRFDEVGSLAAHAEELSKEIDTVQGMLSALDFQSAYAAAGAGVGSVVGSPLGR
jgi:rabenosyn-5